MARPEKLPKVLTEAETTRLLSQPNLRNFSPHRDYLLHVADAKGGISGLGSRVSRVRILPGPPPLSASAGRCFSYLGLSV